MSTVLEELRAAEENARQAADEAFEALSLQISAGTDDPSLDDVQSVLASAGKSAADLTARVADHKYRQELRDRLAEIVGAEEEVPKLREQIAEIEREIERARLAGIAMARPLHIRLQEISAMLAQKNTIENELSEKPQIRKLRREIFADRG